MTGDKKVVIKINLPTSENKDRVTGSDVRHVTEWNTKRLMMWGLILLMLLGGLLYSIFGYKNIQNDKQWVESGKNELATIAGQSRPSNENNATVTPTQQVIEPVIVEESITETNVSKDNQSDQPDNNKGEGDLEIETLTEGEVVANETQETSVLLNEWVTRAQLSNNIHNKEPSGDVQLPFVVNKNKARALFYFTELKDMQGKVAYHQWNYNGKTVFKMKIKVMGDRWRVYSRKMIRNNNLGNWNVRLIDDNGEILNEISFVVVGG